MTLSGIVYHVNSKLEFIWYTRPLLDRLGRVPGVPRQHCNSLNSCPINIRRVPDNSVGKSTGSGREDISTTSSLCFGAAV